MADGTASIGSPVWARVAILPYAALVSAVVAALVCLIVLCLTDHDPHQLFV